MEKEVGELGLQRFIRARIFGVSPKDLFRGAGWQPALPGISARKA